MGIALNNLFSLQQIASGPVFLEAIQGGAFREDTETASAVMQELVDSYRSENKALAHLQLSKALSQNPFSRFKLDGKMVAAVLSAKSNVKPRRFAPVQDLFPSAQNAQHLVEDGLHAVGLTIGPSGFAGPSGPQIRLEPRQTQELSQSLELHQLLELRPLIERDDYYRHVYDKAKKLHLKIPELGLNFEVALIHRLDLPEMTKLGSAGLMVDGLAFVVEDFFVDLKGEERELFTKLVAVHEYGEVLFGDHHLASLLELAVAKHWGVLESYLEFLEKRYAAKFRDVALHRLKTPLLKGLKKEGFRVSKEEMKATVRKPPSKEDPEVRKAQTIIERYPVPPDIQNRFEAAIRDDMKISEEEVEEWVEYVTALEQMRAFHIKACMDVEEALLKTRQNPKASLYDYQLALRLVLFRVLGLMEYEVKEEVLNIGLLEEALQDRLTDEFLKRLRETVVTVNEVLLADPVLYASRIELKTFASLDSQIWRAWDLELLIIPPKNWKKRGIRGGEKLAEIRKEQQEIERRREAAWSYTLTRDNLPRQTFWGLDQYVDEIREFRETFEDPLKETIRSIKSYSLLRLEVTGIRRSLKRRDWVITRSAQLWMDICEIPGFSQAICQNSILADIVQSEINGALANTKFVFRLPPAVYPKEIPIPMVTRIRLEDLGRQYQQASRTNKRDILGFLVELSRFEAMAMLPEYLLTVLRMDRTQDEGLLPRELVFRLAKRLVDEGKIDPFGPIFPSMENFPEHLALVNWDLDRLIKAYRAYFYERAGGSTSNFREFSLQRDFWHRMARHFVGRVSRVFGFVRVSTYAPTFRQAEALEDLTPGTLWERINFEDALLPPREGLDVE